MRERQIPVEFTRSRPYHSDDNAHVVKELDLGRGNPGARLENPVRWNPSARALPEVWALWQNFFALFELEQKWRRAVTGANATSRPGPLTNDCSTGNPAVKESAGNCWCRYASSNPLDWKDVLKKKRN